MSYARQSPILSPGPVGLQGGPCPCKVGQARWAGVRVGT